MINMGQSPAGETYNAIGAGMPLINGPAEFGRLHPTAVQWTTAPTRVCKPNDILFCVRGNTTGRMNIADKEYCIGRGVASLRGITGRLDTSFLQYLLISKNHELYNIAKAGGSTFPNIGQSQLADLAVDIPESLHEQRAIANILETVQKAKEARQRELALERERKAALMEHLFRHGTRGEPSKLAEIGEIPESWKVVELGRIAKIGNGSTPKRSDERYWKAGTIPWITSTQIHDVVIQHANELVTKTAREECHLPLVPKGSVVVAITGQGKTLGNAALLAIDTCINQHLAYIQFERSSVQPEFALFYLQSKYDYLRGVALGGGSTKGALTCGFLKTMPVPVPSADEQSAISGLLLACEKKCWCLERELSVLDEVFVAMLDELMIGSLSAVPLIEEHQPQ